MSALLQLVTPSLIEQDDVGALLTFATRYALRERGHRPRTVRRLLQELWPNVHREDRGVILTDITEAVADHEHAERFLPAGEVDAWKILLASLVVA